MTTNVNRELAKNAINDLADAYACQIVFPPPGLVAEDWVPVTCQASRANYGSLLRGMIAIGLEPALEQVHRLDSVRCEWGLMIRIPETWTPDRVGATAAAVLAQR